MTEGVKEVKRKKRKVNNRFKLLIAVMTFAIQASGILFVNEIYGSPRNCILWVAVQIVLLIAMGLIVLMEVKANHGKLQLANMVLEFAVIVSLVMTIGSAISCII